MVLLPNMKIGSRGRPCLEIIYQQDLRSVTNELVHTQGPSIVDNLHTGQYSGMANQDTLQTSTALLEDFVATHNSLKILDEATGEFRDSVSIEMESNSSYHEQELNTDFSESGSEYIPSESELMDICSEKSYEEILDETSGQIKRKSKIQGRKKKRNCKGQSDKSKWKRIKNSAARLRGEQYEGFQKDENGKYQQSVVRPAKTLQSGCNGHTQLKQGGPRQKFECSSVTENNRQAIFQLFWKMKSWESRKIYVNSLVSLNVPRHRRSSSNENYRKETSFKYFLILEHHSIKKKVHVCKLMFMKTLGIGQRQLRDWLIQAAHSNFPTNSSGSENIQSVECNNLVEFFASVAKVESHYCRSSTSKKYLEPMWNSITGDLYEEYKKFCTTNNKVQHCVASFSRMFRKLNLSIFKPRKDQCSKCIAYKNGNVNEEDYLSHTNKKEKARREKSNDKNNTETDTIVYTMDVQAVLLCPRMQASLTYYKTKLKVHNYTLFNLKTKEAICYLWHEGNGGLESNTFASILIKHLRTEIENSNTKKVILWSDGCGYQNRSVNLSNALLELAIEKDITIEQKYLEVGHTQMEVDSIHSSIEKKLPLHRQIFIPSDYVEIIKSARKKPEPYKVIYLTYEDFYKYDGGKYSSIRPGNKKGDPVVTDICAMQYLPEKKIKYKIDFDYDYEYLPRRPNNKNVITSRLYPSPLPIELSKFIHLQQMKHFINRDYHSFYDLLEHNCDDSSNCPHIIR